MKKRLGNFELLEQIDPGGYTVVWRAVEHMGHGITRPAAVKILQGWQTENQEQIAALRNEVTVLTDICQCPNIVTIYAFDIDPEVGPWIAMELGGQSLRHFITETPASPEQVRQLMRDTLRALMAMHGADPQILHRDLKPNNILSTEFGSWKLADFGLAKRSETESTLNVLTVQYSAPELLDSSLGRECAATDLYSLGLVVYEYALGRRLYRAQFPSIYDPFAEAGAKGGDDRPKWMYWHTSTQMTLKPVAEVIEGFPKDVSDLIAAMVVKPIEQRVPSATEALARLQEASAPPDVRAAMVSIDESRRKRREKESSPVLAIALGAIAFIMIGLMGAWLYMQITSRPSILLPADASFKADLPTIAVRGTINKFPQKGSAAIVLQDGTRTPVSVDTRGTFAAEVRLARLGASTGQLRVQDPKGATLATANIRLERLPPKSVTVVTTTRPPVTDAVVRILESGSDTPIVVRTGPGGQAEAVVKYGKFELQVSHARYAPGSGTFDTGSDPTRPVTATLTPLSESDIASRRRALMGELDDLIRRAGGGDQAAVQRLSEIQREMVSMESTPNSSDAQKRASIMGEMVDTARRAAEGDARAAQRLAELKQEVEAAEASALAEAGSEQRQALMRELAELTDRAAVGDATVLARLRQVQSDIRQLDVEEGATISTAARRARLLGEIGEAAERAARGDAQAAVRLREARRELEQVEAPRVARGLSSRRLELSEALDEAASKAAAGDAAAISALRKLAGEIQELDKDERVPAQIAGRRSRILSDMMELAEQAGKGNIDAALRLKAQQRELAVLDGRTSVSATADTGVNARRRTTLVRELATAITALAGGDSAAAERIRKIRSEFQMIDVSEGGASTAVGRRRSDLLTELAAATELTGSGGADTGARLREIQREMAVLIAVEQTQGDATAFATLASELLGGAPSLDLIDRATLLSLPDEPFRAFVQSVVPGGPVTVETVSNLRRIRVRGTVLNERELQMLMVRLEPALPRLMVEVRADAWAVCRRLAQDLEAKGATKVRVHPHMMPNDNALFVQFSREGGVAESAVRETTQHFVLDQDLIRLQAF